MYVPPTLETLRCKPQSPKPQNVNAKQHTHTQNIYIYICIRLEDSKMQTLNPEQPFSGLPRGHLPGKDARDRGQNREKNLHRTQDASFQKKYRVTVRGSHKGSRMLGYRRHAMQPGCCSGFSGRVLIGKYKMKLESPSPRLLDSTLPQTCKPA